MIFVSLTPSTLRVEGHAAFGTKQKTRVCAAVSALTITYQCYDKPLQSRRGLSVFERKRSPQFAFLLQGLCWLALRYPRNVSFNEDAQDADQPRRAPKR